MGWGGGGRPGGGADLDGAADGADGAVGDVLAADQVPVEQVEVRLALRRRVRARPPARVETLADFQTVAGGARIRQAASGSGRVPGAVYICMSARIHACMYAYNPKNISTHQLDALKNKDVKIATVEGFLLHSLECEHGLPSVRDQLRRLWTKYVRDLYSEEEDADDGESASIGGRSATQGLTTDARRELGQRDDSCVSRGGGGGDELAKAFAHAVYEAWEGVGGEVGGGRVDPSTGSRPIRNVLACYLVGRGATDPFCCIQSAQKALCSAS